MKKHLLPESGNFYKANLHCHTVLSDGCLTPEEVKEIYKNAGYSVVAYTDHDILIPHHAELSDDEFLALNGWEITFTEPQISPIHGVKRVCHMCIIAKDPDNVKQVCWFHRKHFNKNEDKANLADEPEFKPEYTPESINEAIARAKAAGRHSKSDAADGRVQLDSHSHNADLFRYFHCRRLRRIRLHLRRSRIGISDRKHRKRKRQYQSLDNPSLIFHPNTS